MLLKGTDNTYNFGMMLFYYMVFKLKCCKGVISDFDRLTHLHLPSLALDRTRFILTALDAARDGHSRSTTVILIISLTWRRIDCLVVDCVTEHHPVSQRTNSS